ARDLVDEFLEFGDSAQLRLVDNPAGRQSYDAWTAYTRIRPKVKPVLDRILKSDQQFVVEFEKQARATMAALLDESEIRINAERIKYGIPKFDFSPGYHGPGALRRAHQRDVEQQQRLLSGRGEPESPALAGLAAGARAQLALQAELSKEF